MRKISYRLRMSRDIRSKCFASITLLPTTTVPKRFPVVRLLPASFETNSRTVVNNEDVCYIAQEGSSRRCWFFVSPFGGHSDQTNPAQILSSDSGVATAKTFAYEFVDKFLPSRRKMSVRRRKCIASVPFPVSGNRYRQHLSIGRIRISWKEGQFKVQHICVITIPHFDTYYN